MDRPNIARQLRCAEMEISRLSPVEIAANNGRIPWELHADHESSRALLAFANTFPREVLARAAIYASRQWHVLCLQARVPGADELIFHNPALAWMLANNWVFRSGRGSGDAMRNARRWVVKRQPDILNWLGFAGSPALARIVRNIDPKAITVPSMLYLRNASREPECMAAMSRLDRLDAPALRIVTDPALLRSVTPRFLRELDAEAPGREHDNHAWHLRQLIDGERYLFERDEMNGVSLPDRFDSLALLESCHEWIDHEMRMRRLDATRSMRHVEVHRTFPPAPWLGTDAIHPIQDTIQLAKEGDEMQHCVSSFASDVLAGRMYFSRIESPLRATIAFCKKNGEWYPEEIRAPGNASVDRVVATEIVRALTGRSDAPLRGVARHRSPKV